MLAGIDGFFHHREVLHQIDVSVGVNDEPSGDIDELLSTIDGPVAADDASSGTTM